MSRRNKSLKLVNSPKKTFLPPFFQEAAWVVGEVVRSWWEEKGEKEMVPRNFPPFYPLPLINLELTRSGREVAESSRASPWPREGMHSCRRGCH